MNDKLQSVLDKIAKLRALAAGATKTLADVTPYLSRIADLTDRNCHQESLLVLAEDMLEDEPLSAAIRAVIRLHVKAGAITPDIRPIRDYLYTRTMELAEAQLTPDAFAQVRKRF